MDICKTGAILLLLGAAAVGCTSNAPPSSASSMQPALKTETFDKDPGWDGVRNRITLPPVRKQQDFGYSTTNHSGAAPGEIGGVIWRSVTPAYYAKKLPPLTMNDPLRASGTIAVKRAKSGFGWQTGSSVFVGFFNHELQGWRPPNFLGFQLDTHTDTKAERLEQRPGVGLGIGTSKWTAGADHVSTTGRVQPGAAGTSAEDAQEALLVPPDGTRFPWEFRYDPEGGGGAGQVTLVFGGMTCVVTIPPTLRAQGASFDRFGIFNNQIAGDLMEVYLDDITVNGERDDFSSDPHWDAKGNRELVVDTREYGAQNYGYSPATNHAGGAKPGEIGGFFQSVDPWEEQFIGYFGDRVGPLTLDHKLVARGKFSCEREFSIDSTVALGWSNSAGHGWPLKNFVGVFFDSLSDVGRIVQPLYGTRRGTQHRERDFVTFLPDGTDYDWTLAYDPAGAAGRGTITFTINGQTVTGTLAEGDRKIGVTFDRFGVFNLGWANSKHCVVWFDDLTYTAHAPLGATVSKAVAQRIERRGATGK